MKLGLASLILGFCCVLEAVRGQSYAETLGSLPAGKRRMVDASFVPEYYTSSSNYISELQTLYTENTKFIEGYYLFFLRLDQAQMLINPCTKSLKSCLEAKDLTNMVDNPVLLQSGQIIIAWKFSVYLYECTEEFMLKNKCGTFFEIHLPFSPEVLHSYQIKDLNADKLMIESFSTYGLCAGKYEIWLISLTRNGKFIQYIKPIFIQTGNCSCSGTISKLGFSC